MQGFALVIWRSGSPSLYSSHFFGDSSHFLITEPGFESKSMYPVDKLGKSPSPLPLFYLLPTFPHLLNYPGQVCLITFSCSRVFGAQHQKKSRNTTPSHPGCSSKSPSQKLRDAPGLSQTVSHLHSIQMRPLGSSTPPSRGMPCPLPPSPGCWLSPWGPALT